MMFLLYVSLALNAVLIGTLAFAGGIATGRKQADDECSCSCGCSEQVDVDGYCGSCFAAHR